MTQLTNFAFEEHLVRVIERNGEPWFVGKDVCAVLGISKYRDALATLDDDEGCPVVVDTPGGKQEMLAISEAGVYRLVFRSRKPEAERFKRWLAHEVLPAIRRTGSYSLPDQAPQFRETTRLLLEKDAPMGSKAEILRVCRALFGAEAARQLWSDLGLPQISLPDTAGMAEAYAVLARIMAHKPGGSAGRTVKELLMDALHGDEEAGILLRQTGIRPSEETDGFWIGTGHKTLHQIFSTTHWSDGLWRLALRRVEGASSGPRQSFAGHQSRTTWFPLSAMDKVWHHC